jgi:hypothetical protein
MEADPRWRQRIDRRWRHDFDARTHKMMTCSLSFSCWCETSLMFTKMFIYDHGLHEADDKLDEWKWHDLTEFMHQNATSTTCSDVNVLIFNIRGDEFVEYIISIRLCRPGVTPTFMYIMVWRCILLTSCCHPFSPSPYLRKSSLSTSVFTS